ncbi:MAG: response regulator [Christensenellaceae bacterium]|jgi:PAS domain S-box-containing protein|nr:response regulator [Christensenellaceae bacterium]
MKNILKRNILTLLFLFSALIAVGAAIYSGIALHTTSEFISTNISRRLVATSNSAALFVSVEELAVFQAPEDMDLPEYTQLKDRLISFAEENEVVYVYYYRIAERDANGKPTLLQPIIDNDEDLATTYTLHTPPMPLEPALESALAGTTTTTVLGTYSPGYDNLLSAFTPMYDSSGNLYGLAGVDITDDHVFALRKQLTTHIVLMSVAIFLIILCGGLSIAIHTLREKSLKSHVSQLELIEVISRKFLSMDDNSFITNALRELCKFITVSQVILLFDDTSNARDLYHAEGDKDFKDAKSLKAIVRENVQFLSSQTNDSLAVVCSDTAKDARYLDIANSGVKSFIWVPLHIDNNTNSTLIVEERINARTWSVDDVQFVELIGNLLTEALRRKQTNTRLLTMSSIVENSPQIVCHLDSRGMLSYINRASLAQFGFTPSELAEKGMQKIFGDDLTLQIFAEHIPKIRRDGDGDFILPYTRKTGEARMMRAYAFNIGQHATNGIGVIAIDITDNIRIERERIEALEAAKRSSHAKSEFLANMSHEMRTPMNAIIGMTSIAQTAKDIERKDYCLAKISDASAHLLGVINDILDMSKIEANKLELSATEFDFEKTLQKVVNVVNFRIDEKHQVFTVHLDKWIPNSLVGDDQRLAQVITNLLSNAVKFTSEGGKIALNTKLLNEENGICEIQIEVKDNGIGISDEQQAHLFHSFAQADTGIARKFGGTGLGLTISKRIIEMMGGKIWIKSKLGEGATFTFTIQVKRGANSSASLLRSDINWSNIRVLVVDDALDILEYFTDIAKRLGIYCDVAPSGDDALKMISEKGVYDIYFIDWRMPNMDGIELSRRIKSTFSDRSIVIMISSIEWDTIADEAKSAGVDRFIAKPIFPSAIANCINECIGLKNIVDEENAKRSSETDHFEGLTLLLAEDVEINREIVQVLLEPTLLKIDSAVNGAEAVKMFLDPSNHYDVILMDIQMPEMDGYEATALIRSSKVLNSKTIPIIAMTANVFREDVEKCIAAGMNAHVGKPLDFEEVLSVLRKYLCPR